MRSGTMTSPKRAPLLLLLRPLPPSESSGEKRRVLRDFISGIDAFVQRTELTQLGASRLRNQHPPNPFIGAENSAGDAIFHPVRRTRKIASDTVRIP